MAPRRTRKATAAAVEENVVVPVNIEQLNTKPTKVDAKKPKTDAKKGKTVKDLKPDKLNEPTENAENSPVKAQSKSKKATTKKNAKANEQIDSNEENLSPSPKMKKTAKNKTTNDEETNENVIKGVKKTSGRAMQRKESLQNVDIVEEIPTTKKAVKKPKADETNKASPSNTDKKNTKTKSTTAKNTASNKIDDANNENVVDTVAVTKPKRATAKKASAKLPVEVEEIPVTAKKETKKTVDKPKSTKSTKTKEETKQTTETVLENKVADSSKGRKRKKPAETITDKKAKESDDVADIEVPKSNGTAKRGSTKKAPIKQPVEDEVDETSDVVDGIGGSKSNGASKKRKANTTAAADSTTNNEDGENVTKRKKSSKNDDKNDGNTKINATITDYSKIQFESDKEFSLKIVSWNVAGLRALVVKNAMDYFLHEKPDIICLQEIKCLEEDVPEEAKLKGYHPYWCSTPGGRGGVAILSKSMPYNVEKNINDDEMDEEGRIITAEYSKFFLVCVYVPNAGRKLVNLERRLRWNKLFDEHVNKLKAKKPVIICGDMNVAHTEIDLANPKTNRKNAGFSDEERAGMTDLLGYGYIDTFRELYPKKEKAYSFWTYMANARQKNVGWRLDYSIVSENLKSKVVDSFMRPEVLGSDHCPIVLTLNL